MTFLQPVLLFALPAALIPLLIHLLNRLRYRSVHWGAMIFLVKAARSSTRQAILRHYLILMCRILAVLFFVLALCRPIIGGWLGNAMAGSAETVIILLDRSASMEATDPRRRSSKRAHAIDLLGKVAGELGGRSRFVLIDSVMMQPQEIADASVLDSLALAAPTDTAADLPAMLKVALDYIIRSGTGMTEIWIVSDLQKSNWRPESREWARISAQVSALPQDVRVLLVAMLGECGRNSSVSLQAARRQWKAGRSRLRLVVDVVREARGGNEVPLFITLDGVRSQVTLAAASQNVRYQTWLDLPRDQRSGGWGSIEIPADENNRDNTCYFAYGRDIKVRSAVSGSEEKATRCLRLALAPGGAIRNLECDEIAAEELTGLDPSGLAMIAIQGNLPAATTLEPLVEYVAGGGVLLCLPPDGAPGKQPGDNGASLLGKKWGETDNADAGKSFRVVTWEENDGPLAGTAGGDDLPVGALSFKRRARFIADGSVGVDRDQSPESWRTLASFSDGVPFLLRRSVGEGRVYVCTSLPCEPWSNLGDGRVLVPMMQRMLAVGTERLMQSRMADCGSWKPGSDADVWTARSSDAPKSPEWEAGVYQNGEQWIALNRPRLEDEIETCDSRAAASLFGDVPVEVLETFADRKSSPARGEIWHVLAVLVLALLTTESLLVLSDRVGRPPVGDSGMRAGVTI